MAMKASLMYDIKKNIEEIAVAINAVLQVDVTVIDQNHNRIAATGRYVDRIGEKVSLNSIFHKALVTGQAYIVDAPKIHDLCSLCENKEDCEEFAEVCCPIFLEDQVIGIIGLVAFDEFQKNQILSNQMNLLNFLKNMAGLISSKLKEQMAQDKLTQQAKTMEILLNAIDSAVLSLDKKGTILAFNHKAKKLLGRPQISHVKDLIKDFKLSDKSDSDIFEVKTKESVDRYRYKSKPVLVKGELKQIVVTLTEEKDWIHWMSDLVHKRQEVTFDDIIGESLETKKAIEAAKKSADSMSTVLIQGPSGTGKELFARAIHNESKRRQGPFVAINCAAIPESLIESELFGYVEGAFTGAVKGGKPGKFELANKGTIFLDEIGDMPIHLQSKLLRVLQEREVERIGSCYSQEIDVRILAATHQDLITLMSQNKFREDLYYRLNVIPLYLSPLKNRQGDIQALSDFFLNRYNEKLNKSILGFDSRVQACFNLYAWPGNVREMENAIEYSVNMCQRDYIQMEDLPDHMKDEAIKDDVKKNLIPLGELEKRAIKGALEIYGRDKEGISKTIEILEISRATLYRKIKTYKL